MKSEIPNSQIVLGFLLAGYLSSIAASLGFHNMEVASVRRPLEGSTSSPQIVPI